MALYDEWVTQAKCASDPWVQEQLKDRIDPFFGDRNNYASADFAIEYCSDCPVRLACLAEAMKSLSAGFDELQGIWGGTTHRQRRSRHKKNLTQIQLISAQMKAQFPVSENRNEDEVA